MPHKLESFFIRYAREYVSRRELQMQPLYLQEGRCICTLAKQNAMKSYFNELGYLRRRRRASRPGLQVVDASASAAQFSSEQVVRRRTKSPLRGGENSPVEEEASENPVDPADRPFTVIGIGDQEGEQYISGSGKRAFHKRRVRIPQDGEQFAWTISSAPSPPHLPSSSPPPPPIHLIHLPSSSPPPPLLLLPSSSPPPSPPYPGERVSRPIHIRGERISDHRERPVRPVDPADRPFTVIGIGDQEGEQYTSSGNGNKRAFHIMSYVRTVPTVTD